MKRTSLLLIIAAAGFLLLLSSCGGSTEEPFTGSVILKDFTYNGTHPLHLSVISRGGSDSFINVEDPSSSLHSYGTTYTGTGPEDVVVADISIDDPDFDTTIGLNLFLMIASDEDDSGSLTAGDLVLPFYSFLLRNGETLELEGIQFNTGYADVGPYSTNYVWLNIDDLLPFTVDTDNAVVLRVHQATNDFSTGPYYREIVIKDRRLLGDMMLYSFGSAAYYFLLHYDTNGNGSIDSGDHVSYSTITSVDSTYSVDLAAETSGQITLELNSYTLVP